jgi:hypothetical protein
MAVKSLYLAIGLMAMANEIFKLGSYKFLWKEVIMVPKNSV